MAEYIDREALIENLHVLRCCGAEPDTWADGYDKGIDVAYGLAQRTPAADVVKVVQCKDCKFYEAGVDYYDGTKDICRLLKRQMHADDFCSYGERWK